MTIEVELEGMIKVYGEHDEKTACEIANFIQARLGAATDAELEKIAKEKNWDVGKKFSVFQEPSAAKQKSLRRFDLDRLFG